MVWSVKIEDYTSGSLVTTDFYNFSTEELARQRIHTDAETKSEGLNYKLELERDDKYDGHDSENNRRDASILHFHYVRDDTRDWVYTGIVYHTNFPYYSRNDTGVIGDSEERKEGG